MRTGIIIVALIKPYMQEIQTGFPRSGFSSSTLSGVEGRVFTDSSEGESPVLWGVRAKEGKTIGLQSFLVIASTSVPMDRERTRFMFDTGRGLDDGRPKWGRVVMGVKDSFVQQAFHSPIKFEMDDGRISEDCSFLVPVCCNTSSSDIGASLDCDCDHASASLTSDSFSSSGLICTVRLKVRGRPCAIRMSFSLQTQDKRNK
jgi:hypothetical protein